MMQNKIRKKHGMAPLQDVQFMSDQEMVLVMKVVLPPKVKKRRRKLHPKTLPEDEDLYYGSSVGLITE